MDDNIINDPYYVLDAPYHRNTPEDIVINALKKLIVNKEFDFDIVGLVYYPEAFKLLLEHIPEIDDSNITTLFNRIIEYNLDVYNILVEYLKNKKWKSKNNHLRLRPYILKNINVYRINEIYNIFNLYDPNFLKYFYQINTMDTIKSDYYGYRHAWYDIFYGDQDNVLKTIKYIIENDDCTQSGLIDYIIWLNGIEPKVGNKYKKYYDHYESVLKNAEVKTIYYTLVELNENKKKRIKIIYDHLMKQSEINTYINETK